MTCLSNWVLEEDRKVVGWTASTPVRNTPALRNTMAETPVYLSKAVRGRSLGSRLLDHVLNQLANTPIEWVLWFVGASNHASKGMFTKWHCTKLGELQPVDKKPDRDIIEIWVLPMGNVVGKKLET